MFKRSIVGRTRECFPKPGVGENQVLVEKEEEIREMKRQEACCTYNPGKNLFLCQPVKNVAMFHTKPFFLQNCIKVFLFKSLHVACKHIPERQVFGVHGNRKDEEPSCLEHACNALKG